MMNIADYWPIVACAAAVIFGAGQLVEKINNGKYVHKDTCNGVRDHFVYRFDEIAGNLKRIEGKIDELKGEI